MYYGYVGILASVYIRFIVLSYEIQTAQFQNAQDTENVKRNHKTVK